MPVFVVVNWGSGRVNRRDEWWVYGRKIGNLTMTYIKYVEKGVETEIERCGIEVV